MRRALWMLSVCCAVSVAVAAPAAKGGAESTTTRTAASSAPPPGKDAPREFMDKVSLNPHVGPRGELSGQDDRQCALCHTTAGWKPAAFAHERTGFPLRGAHENALCRTCHVKDLTTRVATVCAGCHQDPHRGDFGARCEGCHEEMDWRPLFNADAHRRTNFPLIGRHALLPCTKCHTQMRDRRFTRGVGAPSKDVVCLQCHAADYGRAVTSVGVNHAQLGFGANCQDCHSPFRFEGAKFLQHEVCFQISVGVHSGNSCTSCHTSLANAKVDGSCSTNTAACTGCHAHVKALTDPLHTNPKKPVPGYQFTDRKCYECHKFTKGP